MEEKVKEIVEIKQRSLAEENQKTLEVLKDRYVSAPSGELLDILSLVRVLPLFMLGNELS